MLNFGGRKAAKSAVKVGRNRPTTAAERADPARRPRRIPTRRPAPDPDPDGPGSDPDPAQFSGKSTPPFVLQNGNSVPEFQNPLNSHTQFPKPGNPLTRPELSTRTGPRRKSGSDPDPTRISDPAAAFFYYYYFFFNFYSIFLINLQKIITNKP